MATVVAAMSGVVTPMLVNVTTGSGTIIACPPSFRHHNFMVTGVGTVAAGTVTLETANDPADTGTWAVLTTIAPVTATDLLYQASGLLNFVRARVTTTVSGTTPGVTVNYQGAKSY